MASARLAVPPLSWHATRPLASLSVLSLPQPRLQRFWHVTLLKLRAMLLAQLSRLRRRCKDIVELKARRRCEPRAAWMDSTCGYIGIGDLDSWQTWTADMSQWSRCVCTAHDTLAAQVKQEPLVLIRIMSLNSCVTKNSILYLKMKMYFRIFFSTPTFISHNQS